MAEAIDSETHKKMAEEINQRDLTSETETTEQEIVELQPLLSSQPSDPSHSNLQQQQHGEDNVTKKIEKMIQDCGDGRLLPDCCIYRVPITIRGLKEEAYTPTVVSIGPLHYGNESFKDMETYKQMMFKRFIQRATPKLGLDELVGMVKLLEPRIRRSYSETIKLSEQDLVELTLIDAGFIIELLVMSYMRGYLEGKPTDVRWFLPRRRDPKVPDDMRRDAKLSMPWLDDNIRRDLMLVENQLPYFAIKELFVKAFPRDYRGILPPFVELVCEYFGKYNRQNIKPSEIFSLLSEITLMHFTQLVRFFHLPREPPRRVSFSEDEVHCLSYNANSLQEAGIQLKACESKCLLDLKFSGNVLEIPLITVDDETELLFRNMIAFEQCVYSDDPYITDYVVVMNCLIDTHRDVDLFIHNKIISNCLGDSNSVAELFNGLSKNVFQTTFNSLYLNICRSLKDYCHDPWHKKMATLRRDYCNTPWRTVASIAGIILLVLTIVQTIFSILQVVLK